MVADNVNYEHNLAFNNIVRGIVVFNEDPLNKGRLKIWVPGVYPETFKKDNGKLPWAEPMMSLFGGNFTDSNVDSMNQETGITTVPLVGAQVFLFFENGDQNKPIIFGACQGGSGWISEHINQHVIQTKNVKIKIDEDPSHEKSTNKFDSNGNLNPSIKDSYHITKKNPTRLNIEVESVGQCAVNLNIRGDVNINVNGNVYEQITGNKYETLIGNLYRYHKGDIEYKHDGNTLYFIKGKTTNTFEDNVTELYAKDHLITSTGKVVYNCFNDHLWTIAGMDTKTSLQNYTENISGAKTCTIIGPTTTTCFGGITNLCASNILNVSATHIIDSALLACHRYVFTGFILDKALTCTRKAETTITDEAIVSSSRYSGYILDTTSTFIDHNYNPVPPVILPVTENPINVNGGLII